MRVMNHAAAGRASPLAAVAGRTSAIAPGRRAPPSWPAIADRRQHRPDSHHSRPAKPPDGADERPADRGHEPGTGSPNPARHPRRQRALRRDAREPSAHAGLARRSGIAGKMRRSDRAVDRRLGSCKRSARSGCGHSSLNETFLPGAWNRGAGGVPASTSVAQGRSLTRSSTSIERCAIRPSDGAPDLRPRRSHRAISHRAWGDAMICRCSTRRRIARKRAKITKFDSPMPATSTWMTLAAPP